MVRTSRDRRGRIRRALAAAVLGLVALLVLLPLVLTVADSFMRPAEIDRIYDPAQAAAQDRYLRLRLIPELAGLGQYYTLLIERPRFLYMFWNAAILTAPLLVGQIAVASLAAYAFSKLRFPGRDTLFFVYIAVMLMPHQVTLVPNYIMADRLGLLGSRLAIILPGIFGVFGVFLLRQYMHYVPDVLVQSALADGAGHGVIFFRVVLPLARPGVAALAMLLLVDTWNMVEQPIVFPDDAFLQPLSVYLGRINQGERGLTFAAATIHMVPLVLTFLYGQKALVSGIELSVIRG